MGEYENAIKDFEASLIVKPDDITAFFTRGECLMKLDKLREAEAIFKEGADRFPTSAKLFKEYYEKVILLQRKG